MRGLPHHNWGVFIDASRAPLNTFPVIPREWVQLVGHYCRDSAGDTWWQEIGHRTGTQRVIPVEVLHDHPRMTGNNVDATFAQQNYDPSGFFSQATQALIQRDAELVREWLTANKSRWGMTSTNDVLVIVPTRSRPDRAFAQAFFAISTRSDLLFALDEDAPLLPAPFFIHLDRRDWQPANVHQSLIVRCKNKAAVAKSSPGHRLY